MKTPMELVSLARQRMQEIALVNADQAIRQADVLIDVREGEEFAAGHIPEALHMSRGTLEFRVAGHPKCQSSEARIILYCKTSGRAALAGAALLDMGYSNVSLLAGGFDAWAGASRPVKTPDSRTI
jgi:rhodanese-related sulfurtransferase